MNLRSIGLFLSLTGSLVLATPDDHHGHHHYAKFSKGELIEILKEKESEHLWSKCKVGAVAAVAGFVIGFVVAKA